MKTTNTVKAKPSSRRDEHVDRLARRNAALRHQIDGLHRFAILTFIFGAIVGATFTYVVTMEPVWVGEVLASCESQ